MTNTLHKLRRAFYNAMPVIGPHADIECELLLAGKKPVGFLWVRGEDSPLPTWREKKEHRDRKILDKAVSEGKLKSMDSAGAENIEPGWMFKRFYCQPGREEDMRVVHAVEGGGDPELAASCKKDWDELLGYRKRDVKFWNLYLKLPQSFAARVSELNWISQKIHREEQLRECGIDPEQWIEQLRAENIIT